MVEVFRLVRDLLADDGTLWLNLGDSYNGSRGGEQGKNGQMANRSVAAARCRVRGWTLDAGLKPKDLVGIPWRVAFALQYDGCADFKAVQTLERVRGELLDAYEDEPLPERVISVLERLDTEWREAKGESWYLRQEIIWSKPNPMPESVRDRCTKSHEYMFLLSKRERYYYDADAIAEPMVTGDMRRPYGSPGANALDGRESPQGNGEPRKQRKPAGWDTSAGGHGTIHRNGRAQEIEYTDTDSTTRNKRNVWTVTTQPYADAHFATFPRALIEPCILAGSRTGDTVLDPFMGSGTTAQVAQDLGRKWLGCELNPEYSALQADRTRQIGIAF